MIKRMYILSQLFSEGKGSFIGFVEDLAKYASTRGYAVTILAQKSSKNEPTNEDTLYAKIHKIPAFSTPIFSTFFQTIYYALKTRIYLLKEKINNSDTILANGFTPLGIIDKKYIIRAPDQPVLTILKNFKLSNTKEKYTTKIARFIHFIILYPIDALVMKKATGIIFSSNKNRTENIYWYNVAKTPHIIPNKGVREQYFTTKKINTNKKIVNLLFISSNTERLRKGADTLEKVLPFIFEKYSYVKLLHIGGTFKWNVPEKYAKRITSVGKINNKLMPKYYLMTDIFVMSSICEGVPAALLEAMASETTIISSDIDGINDYITHKKEGYIFSRGDHEELKKGIIFLLDNPHFRDQYAKAAKRKAEQFSNKKYLPKLLKFMV